VPRQEAGAVIEAADGVVTRALAMARDRTVIASDGSRLSLAVDTICLHGDTPGAATLASRLRQALTDAGVSVLPVGSPVS
jgi:UPF0271 protein